jgi:hypothetical protein
MKNIIIIVLVALSAATVSAQTKTIAVLPATTIVDGNIPKNMSAAQVEALRQTISKGYQTQIAAALMRQSFRRRNRRLQVKITTPDSEANATYVIAPQLHRTLVMNPAVASAINLTSGIINNVAQGPYAPRTSSFSQFGQFNLMYAGTDTIAYDTPGGMHRKAKRIFRQLRRGRL